jgi:hypothetical protein
MKKGYIVYLLFLFYACSTEKTYEELNPKPVECLSDTTVYVVMTYYPNGELARKGHIINMQREDIWEEWYADGEARRKMYYENNHIIPMEKFSRPKLIFENDSLIITKKTRLRVLDLLPGEEIETSENVKLVLLEDNSEYDYEVIPLYGDSVSFYYPRRIVLTEDNYKFIANDMDIPLDRLKKLPPGRMIFNIKLKIMPIYKNQ